MAPARATGVGGAFVAYAEGIDAVAENPAAAAVREPYSFEWFDYDLTLGVSFPAAFRGTDFDNDGEVGFTYQNFVFYNFGAELQFGPWGVGVLGDFQSYDFESRERADRQLNETLGKLQVVGGRSFYDGQLSLAAGVRAVSLGLDSSESGSSKSQLNMSGLAPQAGILIRPDYAPWRLGATFRAEVAGRVTTEVAPSAAAASPFVVPSGIFLPWELAVGAAIQVGPRPLNPRWLDPHEQEDRARRDVERDRDARRSAQEAELLGIADREKRHERARELATQEKYIRRDEDARLDGVRDRLSAERRARYANWPRERITVLIDILLTGAVDGAVGLESFFSEQAALGGAQSGRFLRSGQRLTYTPKLGLEGEPVPDRMQTRIGTYIEPSRFGGRSRQHFTCGFDVKLFDWNVFGIAGDTTWRIGGVADLAPRYQSFGVSLGAWH